MNEGTGPDYEGCCSDPNNLLLLGPGTAVATAGITVTTTTPTSLLGKSTVSPNPTAATPSPATSKTFQPTRSTPSIHSTPSPSPAASSNALPLKVGTGIGIPLGIALIIALAYITYLRSKHQRNVADTQVGNRKQEKQTYPAWQHADATWIRDEAAGYNSSEPEGRMPSEMSGQTYPPPTHMELTGQGRSQLPDVHREPATRCPPR